jgi:hypothetical protein
MEEENSWKIKTMVTGGIVGALFGIGISYLLVQRANREQTKPSVGAAEGIQLGLGLLGLLRLVNEWGKPKELSR